MNLTTTLEGEYQRLWDTCRIRPERRAAAAEIVDRIVRGRRRYEAAAHGAPR